jgi:hypothetical protein
MGGSPDAFLSPAGQQIRGKKKLAKVSTVKVQLLQNMRGYGKRGGNSMQRLYVALI